MTPATKVTASVAVIVCAYTADRLDDVTACLSALRRQDRPADEIVCVVDHNEALATTLQQWVDRAGYNNISIIASSGPAGLSGARNTGVASTTSEIVTFVDDDAVPAVDWLREIVAPFAEHDVNGAGGRIEPGWPSDRPSWFPPHLDWTIGCSIPTLPPTGGPIRNMYGASAAFRRSALESVGGFPTELGRVGANGAGCEETEVCIRIRQQIPGATVQYAPKSLVVHRVTAERATVGYVLRRCRAEGRSKARLAARVGSEDATGDERGYALIIMRVVGRDVLASVREPRRIARAAVLVAGLGSASLSYVIERVRVR